MTAPQEIDPDLDVLTRAQLAELPGPAWDVAQILDEWMFRLHGSASSQHGVGLFLDLLAARGYRVEPIAPGPPLGALLPTPTE